MMDSQIRFLLIEDIYNTIAGTIRKIRYIYKERVVIDEVDNVASAVDSLTQQIYQLVILDWRLPEVPDSNVNINAGAIILDFLQSDDCRVENRNVPVIVVTAQGNSIDSNKLQQYGNMRGKFTKLHLARLEKCIVDFIENSG